jgi:hypothetical protein
VTARIKSYTKGGIGGAELRQFTQTGGVGAMQLDPEGLMNLVSVMEAMGGGQVGTGLMAQIQAFVGFRQGAGGQRSFENMSKMGLIDFEKAQREKLVEFTKEGRIKRLKPGAVPISRLLGKDPLMFADAMAEAIKKNGDKVVKREKGMSEEEHLTGVLTQLTSSKTSMNLLAKMILLRENIRKDAAGMRKSMGSEELFKLASEEDIGKLVRFEQEMENFKEKVGLPLIKVLADLATAGKPFIDFLSHHPKLALYSFFAFKAASGFIQMFAALRHFQAANAIINSTAAAAQNAGNQVAWYRRSLTGIPAMVSTTIAVVGLSILIAKIIELKALADEAIADRTKVEKGAADSLKKMYRTPGIKPEQIEQLGKASMGGQISEYAKSFPSLHRSMLDQYIAHFYANPDQYGPQIGDPKNRGMVVTDLQQNFSQLGIPSQFAMFRAQLDKVKMPLAEKQSLFQAAELAFPKAFEDYKQALEKSGYDQAAAIRLLIETDQKAAQGMQNAANAAQQFADKINALKLQPGSGATGESGETPEPIVGHAKGGLTRRNHTANLHRNELILPLDQVPSRVAKELGGGSSSPSVTQHINLVVHVGAGTDVNAIKQAVQQVLLQSKHELNKTLTTATKDRMQSAGG